MKKTAFFLLSFILISGAAVADGRILTNPPEPYVSLGALELKISNQHSYVKYLTLGLLRKRAYARMTRELDKKLLKEARKKYGADAIANVTYWPGPDSGETVDFMYGRAEMIRFKKFPIIPEVPAVPVFESESGTR